MRKPMHEPPDDPFDDILRQIADALRTFDGVSPETEDRLLTGVREALAGIVDSTGETKLILVGTERRPAEERPDLRVVDTEEAERIVHENRPHDTSFGLGDAGPQVRVVRGGAPDAPLGALSAQGAIRVRSIDGERPWQTVFRGEAVRTYRLACDEGQFELAIEGTTIERMSAGQCVDVEARVIRVRSAISMQGSGRYVRLT